jgi:hypothetical protein
MNVNGTFKTKDLQPFESPNLVQSTSATFMTIAAFRSTSRMSSIPASLLLLPAQRLPSHRPTEIGNHRLPVQETDDRWSLNNMKETHIRLLQAAGLASSEWQGGKGTLVANTQTRRSLTKVGEGGMYM